MVPFERAFVTLYRLSIVTFPLSLRVSEILLLLCSSTPLFPNPPLVSPKFLHVHLGLGGWPLGYEERRCWANCPCTQAQFPRFPTYVILIHQRYRRTDDRRHSLSIPHFALICKGRQKQAIAIILFVDLVCHCKILCRPKQACSCSLCFHQHVHQACSCTSVGPYGTTSCLKTNYIRTEQSTDHSE